MYHKEFRTFSNSLALRNDTVLFIVEPSEFSTGLARKHIAICDYPDGRFGPALEMMAAM